MHTCIPAGQNIVNVIKLGLASLLTWLNVQSLLRTTICPILNPSSIFQAMAVAAFLCRFLNISAFLFLLIASLVCSLSFDLPSIGPGNAYVRIKLEGGASITDQGIQVTPNEAESELMRDKAGRATYMEPLHLWDMASGELADFTTNFTFTISSNGSSSYADGLTFFLANFSTPLNITLTDGGGLGLMNQTQSTPPPDPFVAVVFDTFSRQNNRPQTNVSINIESMLEPAVIKPWLNNIALGMSNTASITYSVSSKILQVVFTGFWNGQYLTDSLSYEVDLRKHLPEFVSIGFSAATGWFFEKNTVSSWQFSSTPPRSRNVSVSPAPNPSPQEQHTVPAPGPGTSLNRNITNMASGGRKHKKRLVIAGLSIGVLVFVALLSIAISAYFKKTRGAKRNNQIILGAAMEGEFEMAGYGPKNFSYSELAAATDNFSEEHKLGEGGFGGVYSGFLRDLNLDVAVKRVSSQSKQGIEEYTSEVKIISQLRHRNLVPLHGWCHENGELLLVYEYMPGGSLDSHLFKRKAPLNWRLRYKIAQGLASALSYLHEDWEQCVLHRDIKSSNILLDSSFNARLGDFGLAWLVDHEQTPEKTYLGGTPGYVAPECHITFKTSKESDVYSFGVVALEIACGRKAILANKQEDRKSLVDWVWDLYGMGRLLEAADPKLCGNFEEQEMERLMIIGLWCAHPDSNSRPKISLALHCLKFQVQLPILPEKMPKPVYSTTLPNALSFPASHFSGIKNVEIQEFEYPSSSSQNSRFTSSSTSGGSSVPHTV